MKELLTRLDFIDKEISTLIETTNVATEAILIKWKIYSFLRIFGDNTKINFALRALNKLDKNTNLLDIDIIHRLTDYHNNENIINALIYEFEFLNEIVGDGVNALLDKVGSFVPNKKSSLAIEVDNNFPEDLDWNRPLHIYCKSGEQTTIEFDIKRDRDTTIFYNIGAENPAFMRAAVIYSGQSNSLMGPATRVSLAGITETVFHHIGILEYGKENFKSSFMYDPFYEDLVKNSKL